MSDAASLIKKVNELITLVKADPMTKLPGVLINKAAPAPAPAMAPKPPAGPKMAIPKINVPKPPAMHMTQPMGKAYTASEGDKSTHLAKWLHKCTGTMKMAKSDMEKQRMTDPNVAAVRMQETEASRQAEHKDQVATHASTVKQKKDDAIKQDKGHDPVHPGKEKVVPQVTKAELAKDGGTAGAPTSRIDTGFGRVIIANSEKEPTNLMKPVPEGVSPKKFDSCVDQVKAKGEKVNAYAVCNSSLKKEDMGRMIDTLRMSKNKKS